MASPRRRRRPSHAASSRRHLSPRRRPRWTDEEAEAWGWNPYRDRANWGHSEWAAYDVGDFSHKYCPTCGDCNVCYPCKHAKT